jgi:hypothetical protein
VLLIHNFGATGGGLLGTRGPWGRESVTWNEFLSGSAAAEEQSVDHRRWDPLPSR